MRLHSLVMDTLSIGSREILLMLSSMVKTATMQHLKPPIKSEHRIGLVEHRN